MRAKGLLAAVLVLVSGTAIAGGPRFLATAAAGGQPIGWTGPVLRYYTDPGNLSMAVSHAQADAVVAAAAAVWNVPTSGLTLAQGGVLGEHVSSANSYFDGKGVVFPADVQVTNAASMPIAVIYDSDGSVTDLLLGSGASDPSGCRQNEVTESVDGLGDTAIQHALLILNGRCLTGASADQLNQLKYMVMRKLGRVLGLAWSQTNDSVFTGSVPTTAQLMANWPVMHPIDVICGTYTYLCMQNPFVLRVDDLNALAMLYPVTAANLTAGKTLTAAGALEVVGPVTFPNNLGMDQLNMVVRIQVRTGAELQAWQLTSGVTGFSATPELGNPVSGMLDASTLRGWADPFSRASYFDMKRVPIPVGAVVHVEMESINPLYTGAYALMSTGGAPVSMSGVATENIFWPSPTDTWRGAGSVMTAASGTCWTALSGSESAPTVVDASGFWAGQLCSLNHPHWGAVKVRAGRTWTLESVATDETGGQTTRKAQPVLGVWNAADAAGVLPTVAAMPVPMNGHVTGLTQLVVPASSVDASYRFAVAEAHGHGRPDMTFNGRVLYADAVSPAITTVNGGQITITGMGFSNGNRVLVNGVVAAVTSWSSTRIVATAPTMGVARAQAGVPVSVSVVDLTTGGSTVMSGALSYPGGAAYGLLKMSAPAALKTGATAATAFAVKAVAADGVTAIPGASVKFAVMGGSAGLVACGVATSCFLTTNASGVAQTSVSGVSAGAVVLTATEVTGGASVQVSMVDTDPVRSVSITTPTAYVAAGGVVSVPVVLNAVQDGVAASGVAVTWGVSAGLGLSGASVSTAADGSASVTVNTGGLNGGVRGCAWSTVCADWSVVAVSADKWIPSVMSGAGQSVPYTAQLTPLVVRVTDGAGHALAGALVNVSQTVTAWQGVCPGRGRCASAPVLAANVASAVTDANGLMTVTPLQVSGVAQVVNVAVATGTNGFLALSLVKVP